MFDIGILGGMGPIATSVLFNRIVNYTFANKDQDHPKVIVIDDTSVPDRTEYILQKSNKNPLPEIEKNIDILNSLGCKTVVLGCNTAHYFAKQIAKKASGRFLNMVKLSLDYISMARLPERICVLCTLGSKNADIFSQYHAKVFYPDDKTCEKIQEIIYYIKDTARFDLPYAASEMKDIMRGIERQYGENITFLLGCTELSVLGESIQDKNVVDAMDVVAVSSILASGFTPRMGEGALDVSIIKQLVGV